MKARESTNILSNWSTRAHPGAGQLPGADTHPTKLLDFGFSFIDDSEARGALLSENCLCPLHGCAF